MFQNIPYTNSILDLEEEKKKRDTIPMMQSMITVLYMTTKTTDRYGNVYTRAH